MLLWATGATLLEVDERARVVRCVAPSMLLGAADVAGQPLAQLLPGPSAPELLRLVERALSQGAAGQLRATLGLPHGAREVLVDVLPPPRDRSCVGVLLRDAADHASASDPGVYLAALCRLGAVQDADLADTLRLILQAAGAALGVRRAGFWTLEPAPERLVCCAVFDAANPAAPVGMGLVASAHPAYFGALQRHAVIPASDAAADPRTCELTAGVLSPLGVASCLDVPVWHRGRVVGVLRLEAVGAPRTWEPVEQEFAVSVGQLLSQALAAEDARTQQRALQDSDARLRLISRASNDILWSWDVSTDWAELTDDVPTVLGHAVPGRRLPLMQFGALVHPEDAARVAASVRTALANAGSAWTETFRVRAADGSYVHILTRAFLDRSPDGAPRRVVGACTDVTHQRRLESQLILQDRLASVGTLAAGVAHEINNPLAYVTVNLGYLQDELAKLSAALVPGVPVTKEQTMALTDFTEAVREARTGTARVKQVVRDLQSFSQPDVEGRRALDVRLILEGAMSMATTTLRHRAQLLRDLAPAPLVMADAGQLSQVFLNLIMNAAQAIPEGSVAGHVITVRTLTRADGCCVVEVQDDGVGIPEAQQSRIFEPFFTTKPLGEGMGLGLSVCHGLVKGMGGDITFESSAGVGTTFRVVLPPAPERGSAAAPQETKAARVRMLVVDDEPWIITGLRRALGRGLELVAVHSGREALERLAMDDAFDVILCDLMMPDQTGMDVHAHLVRTRPDLAERLIFMTGGTYTQRAREFLATVTHPRLEKPFEAEELQKLLACRGPPAGPEG